MRNDLVAYINGKAYHVVSGAVYSEEYNETLDSLSIVLDNVAKADRIEIRPYDFVRVKNMGDGVPFNVEMLVDNWVESEENIAQHVYKYQISLMSETKLLEKTQCPNIAITHSEAKGKKDIYEHIRRYFELYAPKIKMKTSEAKWDYKPLYELDEESLKAKFQGVPCADMTMQMPTLRQLFTNLMLQKGCIPILKERKLAYLDLTAKAVFFNIDAKGVNKVQRSNSSDSYVNVLESQNDQLLDTGNKVISETLGFRDKDNVLIKQDENLKLETAFPIYGVSKCAMRIPSAISSTFQADNINYDSEDPTLPAFRIKREGNNIQIMFYAYEEQKGEIPSVAEAFITFYEGTYVVKKTVDVTKLFAWNTWYAVAIPDGLAGSDKFYFYSRLSDGRIIATRLCNLDANAVASIKTPMTFDDGKRGVYGYFKTDITPNVVENSKRKLLDTDFTTMPNDATPSELAKWIYGTVGYSIGSKTITGFSQKYSKAQGWWNNEKTYFENIVNVLADGGKYYPTSRFDDSVEQAYREWLGGYKGELELKPSPYSSTFASAIFDIEYQPLNSVTFKAYKEEAPVEYTQLDGTASGLTDFDRFSKNLQEKADRLGNEVMSINQTTDDATALQSLNADYDDHICFKRTLAIANNYVQATYALSKDYVIKNYFTSITTKYRAYEHVDYNQSTLRKEHKNVFVTIDTENHQGECETISFYEEPVSAFLKGLFPYEKGKGLRYAIEQGESEGGALETAKYDLSVVTCGSAILLSYESPDNVGAGSYLKSPLVDADLGGVTQTWQIWGESYHESRFVGFVDYLPYYESTGTDLFGKASKTPLYPDNAEATANIKISSKDNWLLYKDEAERLNMTVQFTYVNKAKGYFDFTEEFLKNMPYVDNSTYGHANAIVGLINNRNLIDYPNKVGAIRLNEDGSLAPVSDFVSLGADGTSVTFKGLVFGKKLIPYKIVHAYKDANGEWEWVDIALCYSASRDGMTLHVYLNDTNTQKVLAEDEYGVLRPMYEDDGNGNKGLKSL